MKRCPNCNRVHSDIAKVCSSCGTDLCGNAAPVRPQNTQNYTTVEQKKETRVVQGQVIKPAVQNDSVKDSGSILWALPGLFVPIVGWILYFVWKDKKPNTAKVANIGAWIGFVSAVLLTMAGM